MSDNPAQNRLTNWLLTFLTAGFMAWAGVVFQTGDRMLNKLNEIYADVKSQAVQIHHIEKGLGEHRLKPWHQRAGEEINRMRGYDNER